MARPSPWALIDSLAAPSGHSGRSPRGLTRRAHAGVVWRRALARMIQRSGSRRRRAAQHGKQAGPRLAFAAGGVRGKVGTHGAAALLEARRRLALARDAVERLERLCRARQGWGRFLGLLSENEHRCDT